MSEEQTENTEHEQMAEDFKQKFLYVQQWLECAPDFDVILSVFVSKIMFDRNLPHPPDKEEINRVGGWLEEFYKSMSAVLGVLAGHIEITFPEGADGPRVTVTEQGNQWIQEQQKAHRANNQEGA